MMMRREPVEEAVSYVTTGERPGLVSPRPRRRRPRARRRRPRAGRRAEAHRFPEGRRGPRRGDGPRPSREARRPRPGTCTVHRIPRPAPRPPGRPGTPGAGAAAAADAAAGGRQGGADRRPDRRPRPGRSPAGQLAGRPQPGRVPDLQGPPRGGRRRGLPPDRCHDARYATESFGPSRSRLRPIPHHHDGAPDGRRGRLHQAEGAVHPGDLDRRRSLGAASRAQGGRRSHPRLLGEEPGGPDRGSVVSHARRRPRRALAMAPGRLVHRLSRGCPGAPRDPDIPRGDRDLAPPRRPAPAPRRGAPREARPDRRRADGPARRGTSTRAARSPATRPTARGWSRPTR